MHVAGLQAWNMYVGVVIARASTSHAVLAPIKHAPNLNSVENVASVNKKVNLAAIYVLY